MLRTLYLALALSLLSVQPVRAAQQPNPPAPNPEPGESSSRAAPDQTQPAVPLSTPAQDSAAADAANAEHAIEVGEFYVRKGDIDAAINRFQEAVSLQPKLARARLLLAETYEKKGDKAAALKVYQEYLRLFPNASDAKKIEKKIRHLAAR